ncbi:unnamed protein product, partial [Rotaria sp. Silwood2]
HVQSLALSSSYLDNLIIRSVIRKMITLALASEQYVSSLFDNLAHVVRLLELRRYTAVREETAGTPAVYRR